MKSKQFIAGIVVGAVMTGTVGVFASGQIVQATKTDDTRIFVDNEEIETPEGYAILNYEGRVYTSARQIAEALGAHVNYIQANGQKNIYITSKQTPITDPMPPTATPEPTPEPTPTPTPSPAVDYRTPPVKGSALGTTVYVKSAMNPYDELEVKVEVSNFNVEGSTLFNYGAFKIIDTEDNIYNIKQNLNDTMFLNSIPNKSEDLAETLKFNNIPAGTKCTLIMPLMYYRVDGSIDNVDIEIPMIIEEYNTTNSK